MFGFMFSDATDDLLNFFSNTLFMKGLLGASSLYYPASLPHDL